jgi:carbamoyltransferase
MNILSISCFYHDSAACFVRNGEIIAAAQEGRFTRKKHDASFPINAINYCLKEAGSDAGGLDFVAFYDKPFIKFERILETALSYVPSGITQFIEAVPVWLKQKLWVIEVIKKELDFSGKILFADNRATFVSRPFDIFFPPFSEHALYLYFILRRRRFWALYRPI